MLCARFLLTLALLAACRVRCLTLNELLDFTSFLERTSLIDKPRIEGVTLEGAPPHAEAQDEEVPADADTDVPTPDAWELSGKFEGDMILSPRQRRVIVEDVAEGLSRNGVTDVTKRWPNNELVYFIQKEHFSDDQVQAIVDGLDDIARSSCITHRPYKKGDQDAVVVVGHKRGCFSAVGYQGGYQVLNLSARHPLGRGCFRHGTVVHEFLHSLGFYHMQSSSDRDDYVNVLWDNIHEGAKHNFRKYNTFSVNDFGVPYDYDSVLHYSKRAFSKNGKATLVPKQSGASIGQRTGMSQGDVEKLNRMYCGKDSGSGSGSFDDAKESYKKPTSKKKNNNKPFEGHGLGYYKGKSIVVKLPKMETFVINQDDVQDTPAEIEYSYPNYNFNHDYEFTPTKTTKTNIESNAENSDEVFIDIDKIMANINTYNISKPIYDGYEAPNHRNNEESYEYPYHYSGQLKYAEQKKVDPNIHTGVGDYSSDENVKFYQSPVFDYESFGSDNLEKEKHGFVSKNTESAQHAAVPSFEYYQRHDSPYTPENTYRHLSGQFKPSFVNNNQESIVYDMEPLKEKKPQLQNIPLKYTHEEFPRQKPNDSDIAKDTRQSFLLNAKTDNPRITAHKSEELNVPRISVSVKDWFNK